MILGLSGEEVSELLLPFKQIGLDSARPDSTFFVWSSGVDDCQVERSRDLPFKDLPQTETSFPLCLVEQGEALKKQQVTVFSEQASPRQVTETIVRSSVFTLAGRAFLRCLP